MAQTPETYQRALVAVREVVNAWDPIGLIEIGAPDDEYDPESSDLVRLVLHRQPIDQKAVDDVWTRWFGDTYRLAGSAESASLAADLARLQTAFADG
ncbi:MAG: hypothetical protein WBA45_01875 [Microthrixaceae bacterium]